MFLPRSVKHYLRPIIIVIVIAILAFQTGCETSSAKPSRDNGRPRQANSSDFFSPPQLSAVAFAFRHWEEHSRTEALPYQVDSYDRRLPPRFRQRLQAMLPELSVIDGEPAWTFAFNRIVFPEDNWAYVVYRESNPYHAIEYADVLRWVDEQWVLMDHLVIAEGLMDTVMTDFQWSAYRATHLNHEGRLEPERSTND